MIRRAAFIIFFFVAAILGGCKSDKAPLPENVLRISNGSHKDWKLDKVTYLFLNVTNRIPECQKDEIYRFYADGRGEILSGSNPCSTPEPEVQSSGTWEFTGQGETLIVTWKEEANWEANVDRLEADKLVVTGTVFDNYVVTATFSPVQ